MKLRHKAVGLLKWVVPFVLVFILPLKNTQETIVQIITSPLEISVNYNSPPVAAKHDIVLNKFDEETILQFIELWHNYSNREKFMLLAKKCWSACVSFVENSGLKNNVRKFFDELKVKSKIAEAELDAEVDAAIDEIKNIKF